MVFVLLALFLGQFGSGVYDLVFSNFLRDAQHLDVEMRGLIEFPRELPGILSLFVVSLLFMFNEVRVAGVACLLMFGGMYALAFCGAGTSLWTLSAWILTVSLGQHILMGMIDTIVIHTARPEKPQPAAWPDEGSGNGCRAAGGAVRVDQVEIQPVFCRGLFRHGGRVPAGVPVSEPGEDARLPAAARLEAMFRLQAQVCRLLWVGNSARHPQAALSDLWFLADGQHAGPASRIYRKKPCSWPVSSDWLLNPLSAGASSATGNGR